LDREQRAHPHQPADLPAPVERDPASMTGARGAAKGGNNQ
jgi:hypothetical protein